MSRTLHEAKVEVAKASAAVEEARKVMSAAFEPFSSMHRKEWEATSEEYIKAKREWSYREHELDALLEECAADPELRKHMTCATVRFEGKAEPPWITEQREPTQEEFNSAVWGGKDPVSTLVREWVYARGFSSSGSGSGLGGWDIEVRPVVVNDGEYDTAHEIQFLAVLTSKGPITCETHNEFSGSYEEMAKLCDDATEHFRAHLDARALKIRFSLHNWRFRNFGYDDMMKLLVS